MGRPPKFSFSFGISLRQQWQAINRQAREAKAQERAEHKARDQHRARYQCEAYPWPHRPRGGFCRFPDPPIEKHQPNPKTRCYRNRYIGLRRQIARANGLHPIKDRAAIEALMPRTMFLAKQLHRQHPKYKYRNVAITDKGITGNWTPAGPTM